MNNPYLLPNPSVVSFSGGRTSAYMLRKILDAFGGTLPDWVRVLFENTGKEREETLEFVERCSREWSVPITWLEYRYRPGDEPLCSAKHTYEVVDFLSASRKGEPFLQAIRARNYLPNPIARFCTVEMKMLTSNRYVRESLGWDTYHSAVGLRADEPKRVAKTRKTPDQAAYLFEPLSALRVKSGRPTGESVLVPLFDAGVTLETVSEFWAQNDFDLALRSDEGNCDFCFLKGAGKILQLIRERPAAVDWWIEAEAEALSSKPYGAVFRKDRPSYAEMKRIALDTQDGPGWLWADNANNGSCGELEECRCTD